EDDEDRDPAAHAPRDQPLGDRVEPDREEQRDDDENDDAARVDDGLHEEVRDEDAERTEEAEHERRVAADRPPEPPERRVLAVRADLALALAGGGSGPSGVLVEHERLVAGV